ncbi:trypsin-like serine protease [Rothia sp. CCM 9419]|uniref:trypsin-like serine protease n=1 Tax=Rothia sp. CCM 9419 TaxID=3402662 RepID=UPI003AE25D43
MARFKKLRFLAAAALSTVFVAPVAAPAHAVVGGFNSNQSATVRLWAYGYKAPDLLCSGSHIGNGWVLTAKHCVDDIGVNTWSSRVVWGNPRINWNLPENQYTGPNSGIDRIVTHPDENKDMALVHVPGLAKARVATYRLRDGGTAEDLKNARCTAYGYGLWEDNIDSESSYAQRQRGLKMKIRYASTSIKNSNSAQLRGYNDRGGFLVTGDSGGSLVCNGVLSGVTVAYWPKSKSNSFMSISAPERDWIYRTTGI